MTTQLLGGRTMREQFAATVADLLDDDSRVAVVLADISSDAFAAAMRTHPARVFNVGIREQLMVSTAGGLALIGMRPIIHSYAPFVVSRAFEQLKLDIGYQGLGAVVVSIGSSYDDTGAGMTHFAPEDVALFDTLPGWQVHVPAHVDEVDPVLRDAGADGGRHYIRLTRRGSAAIVVARTGAATCARDRGRSDSAAVEEATRGLDVPVLHVTAVRPFPAQALRRRVFELSGDADVVLVEPYLAGSSAHDVAAALVDVRHRLLSLGVGRRDLHRYGSAGDHDVAHGLDAASLRVAIGDFVAAAVQSGG